MFTRIVKSVVVGALAYQASRATIKHNKLMAIRADAKAEMDRLEIEMLTLYNKDRTSAAGREFQMLVKQHSKWSMVHAKTF